MNKDELYEQCYQIAIKKEIFVTRKWISNWLDKLIVFNDDGTVEFVNNYPMMKIYCLVNPIDNSIFYIGRTTTSLKLRLRMHVSNLKNGNKRKQAIILDIQNAGKKVLIRELEEFQPIHDMEYTGEHDREKFWINKFSSEGEPITNRSAFRIKGSFEA